MATSSVNPLPVDPAKNAKYPVIISERLLNENQRSGWNLATVQVNHQPKPSQPFKKTTITPAESGGDNCNLHLIGDNDRDAYTYAGSQQASETCALVFDPVTQTFTLDKIDTHFTFNLRSTPTNKSAKALAAQYPQLETTAPDPTSSDEEEQSFDASEEVGDPDNPYDWRHFLNRRSSSPEPPIVVEEVPVPQPSIAPPARRQSRTKVKQRPHHHRPQPKRASTPPREEADADNEDSDDGGLTIEMDPVTKPRHRFGNAFGNISGDGPISLRSAASSVSPAGGLEIDFGHESSQNEEEDEEEDEEESDEDVPDDVKLPSPLARAATTPMQGVTEQEEEEEEEDDEDAGDLEAELEREMEREADGEGEVEEEGGGVGVGVETGVGAGRSGYLEESSSESEEE